MHVCGVLVACACVPASKRRKTYVFQPKYTHLTCDLGSHNSNKPSTNTHTTNEYLKDSCACHACAPHKHFICGPALGTSHRTLNTHINNSETWRKTNARCVAVHLSLLYRFTMISFFLSFFRFFFSFSLSVECLC